MKKNPHHPLFRPRQLALALPAACALALLAAAPARATTYTWLNSGSDFTTAANWSPSGPPNGITDLAQFTTRGTFGSAAVNPVVNSARNSRLWFGNTALGGGYTLSGTGSVTGGNSSNSGLITRGIGNTTISLGNGTATSLALTGTTAAQPPAIDVGYGSTLTLAGNTVATANSLQVRGTLVLDNSAGNPASQRLTLPQNGGLYLTGGGAAVEFKSSATGSSNFSGFSSSDVSLNIYSGYSSVRMNQTSATGKLTVTFSSFTPQSGSVNFVNAGNGTLGGSGISPALKFSSSPPSTTNSAIIYDGLGAMAIVNGSDFAGYSGTNGVFAITSTAVSGALSDNSTQNSRLTGNATISGDVGYNTLKIAPTASGQSLAIGSGSSLSPAGILLAGSTSYAITGTGTSVLNSTGGPIFVTDPAAVLSMTANFGPANSGGFDDVPATFSKAGDGFLWLNGTANQASYGSYSFTPTLQIQGGVLRVNSTSFDLTGGTAPIVALRGGTLEYDVSGGAFTFNRALGTSAGQVSWRGATALDTGSGGFSAYAGVGNGNGNALTVNLGGSGATLTWGTTANFVADGEALKFGSTLSNSTVIWQNPIALDGGTAGDYAIRQIDVTRGVGFATTDKTRLAGVISGSSTTDLVKTGTGTLELAAANTYAGNTLVAAGTLRLGAAGVIPDGSGKGNVAVTGTLDLNAFSEAINGLFGSGVVDTVAGGSPTFTVGAGDATSTFAGTIKNTAGTLALTKTGTGTLTLSGANTYTGSTAISAGKLVVDGSIMSATTVNSGGTLGGHGTITGNVTINSGSTLSPGNSPGVMTVNGNLTLAGTTQMEITGTTRGADPGYDAFNITGASHTITLGGTMELRFGAQPTAANYGTYDLFDWGSSSPLAGSHFSAITVYYGGVSQGSLTRSIAGVGQNWTATFGAGNLTYTFNEGSGNLAVVPEPGTEAAAAFLAILVLAKRRRARVPAGDAARS